MICEKCGQEMDMIDKCTAFGRDMREYCCRPCDHYQTEDNGEALWKVLHDANEKTLDK